MAVEESLQGGMHIVRPWGAFSPGEIDEGVHALEDRGELAGRFVHEEHHIVESFGGDAQEAHVHGKAITSANLTDVMDMVFEIHRSRLAGFVVGIA